VQGVAHSVVNLPCPSPADILPGQGLFYQTTTKTWRAQDCTYNNYGVANITYGLTPAPCVACPSGMIASSSATYPTSAKFRVAKGFNNVMACVNLPGNFHLADPIRVL